MDEWKEVFSPAELTSISLASTIASHYEYNNGRGGAIKDSLPNIGSISMKYEYSEDLALVMMNVF